MGSTKEIMCLQELDKVLSRAFSPEEYSLNGPKESAVCLEYDGSIWDVYAKQCNTINDLSHFENVVDAGIEVIRRISYSDDYDKYKNQYLNAIEKCVY